MAHQNREKCIFIPNVKVILKWLRQTRKEKEPIIIRAMELEGVVEPKESE